MPYTTITPPTVGDPTRKSFADAVIDNLDFLNTEVARLGGASLVKNGSFEATTGGAADGWDVNTYLSGAAGVVGNGLGDTNCVHGARAFKFISPGGGGSFGGGYVETLDFFVVTPQRPLLLTWQWFSTAATVCNKVEVQWYTMAQALISTTTVANVSTGNPSAWRQEFATAVPPATARYAKLKLIGGDPSSSTAGSTYFDDVYVTDQELRFERAAEFEGSAAGDLTFTWRSPATAGLARVTLFAGGGGGGGSGTSGAGFTFGGGGGGSGEMVTGCITYAANTDYTIVVGRGGSVATSTAGGNGGNSTFASTTLVATGGSGGSTGATGTLGAAGTGGTGMIHLDGRAGTAGAAGGLGGLGGDSVRGAGGGQPGPGAVRAQPTTGRPPRAQARTGLAVEAQAEPRRARPQGVLVVRGSRGWSIEPSALPTVRRGGLCKARLKLPAELKAKWRFALSKGLVRIGKSANRAFCQTER